MNILAIVPRLYVSDLQTHLEFYKILLKQEKPQEFQINGTHVIRFTNLLLIEEVDEPLKKRVAVTLVIDNLQEVKKLILNYNGVIITEPIQIPTGMKMIVRHPDGNIIEYIEPTLK
ncbi:hypothetical protein P4K91_08320 [Bacillus anthracis]|uniref:hypothetical protein n=1 Tax=Bacillus anthracis TaxID=1392 RepID=UPI002DB6B536|nr:hypothetical protein [Bacillus anthracis]MEB9905372.1 hypothetical protein [Bacillus anthracis]MEC1956390.1 hypothetical protein [Bacillus anthracis]